jgi:hypothetical protein
MTASGNFFTIQFEYSPMAAIGRVLLDRFHKFVSFELLLGTA